MNLLKPLSFAMLSALMLTACGGGGGSDDDPVNPPDGSSSEISVDLFGINETKAVPGYLGGDYVVIKNPTLGTIKKLEDGSLVYEYKGPSSYDLVNGSCGELLNLEKDSFTYTQINADNELISKAISVNLTRDPLLKYSWHLCNYGQDSLASGDANILAGNDINVLGSWLNGANGANVATFIIDSGFDSEHEDIQGRISNLTTNDNSVSPYHGSAVMGIIASNANKLGTRGVAYKTNLHLYRGLSTLPLSLSQIPDEKFAIGDTLVSPLNMSLGSPAPYVTRIFGTLSALGYIFDVSVLPVVSAGNYYNSRSIANIMSSAVISPLYSAQDCLEKGTNCFFSNTAAFARAPDAIVVAAGKADGTKTSYSTTGSNVWITALGSSSNGHDILTTDYSDCSDGYAESRSSIAFDNGSSSLNANCYYTISMNGTSSAAPMVTGAVANIVSKKPNITGEQIRYVIAKTANTSHEISNILEDAKDDWLVNGAGVRYSNDFGFGWIDVAKAVSYAENSCDTDEDCERRARFQDVGLELSTSCTIIAGNAANNYECKAVLPRDIQIENTQIDIENAQFNASAANSACAFLGKLKGLPERLSVDGSATTNQKDGALILRNLVIKTGSSLTSNRYIVKAKYENFFGFGSDSELMVGEEPNYINVNALYRERLPAGDSVSVYFSSECPMTFNGSVVIKLTGFSL